MCRYLALGDELRLSIASYFSILYVLSIYLLNITGDRLYCYNYTYPPCYHREVKRIDRFSTTKAKATSFQKIAQYQQNMKFFLLLIASIATGINAFFATLPPTCPSSPSLSSLYLLDAIADGLFEAVEADADEFKEAYAENHRKAFLLDIRDWKEAHLSHATPAPYSQLMSGK